MFFVDRGRREEVKFHKDPAHGWVSDCDFDTWIAKRIAAQIKKLYPEDRITIIKIDGLYGPIPDRDQVVIKFSDAANEADFIATNSVRQIFPKFGNAVIHWANNIGM